MKNCKVVNVIFALQIHTLSIYAKPKRTHFPNFFIIMFILQITACT